MKMFYSKDILKVPDKLTKEVLRLPDSEFVRVVREKFTLNVNAAVGRELSMISSENSSDKAIEAADTAKAILDIIEMKRGENEENERNIRIALRETLEAIIGALTIDCHDSIDSVT